MGWHIVLMQNPPISSQSWRPFPSHLFPQFFQDFNIIVLIVWPVGTHSAITTLWISEKINSMTLDSELPDFSLPSFKVVFVQLIAFLEPFLQSPFSCSVDLLKCVKNFPSKSVILAFAQNPNLRSFRITSCTFSVLLVVTDLHE
jgi:hypothetical protein